MNIIVYGTLRRKGKFSFLLPSPQFHKIITLKGFEMYDLKNKPASRVSNNKENFIICEVLGYTNSSYVTRKYILFVLSILELTFIRKYKRYLIQFEPSTYGYIYLYNWKINTEKFKKINDWIEEKKE